MKIYIMNGHAMTEVAYGDYVRNEVAYHADKAKEMIARMDSAVTEVETYLGWAKDNLVERVQFVIADYDKCKILTKVWEQAKTYAPDTPRACMGIEKCYGDDEGKIRIFVETRMMGDFVEVLRKGIALWQRHYDDRGTPEAIMRRLPVHEYVISEDLPTDLPHYTSFDF